MEATLAVLRRPRPRADIQEELVGDQLFLYRAEDAETVHCLNSGAAVIWLLCDGARDEASLAHELSEAYHVPEPIALEDIRTTLAQLQDLGLLDTSDQGSGPSTHAEER